VSSKEQTTVEQRWVLGLTSIGSVMVALDVLVVAAALTTIRQGLGASIEQLEWTVNAYSLSFAMLLMTAGQRGPPLRNRLEFAAMAWPKTTRSRHPSGTAIFVLAGQSGGRGIRTHVRIAPEAVFKTAAIGH
jgi:hypothetical protein